MEVIDIRDACCLVSAGLDRKLRVLPSGEQVEVIISTDVGEEMLLSVAKKENCEVLQSKVEEETIRAVVKKK